MDEKMVKKLSAVLSKLPKKDLSKNLEKAKNIIKNSNKEDIKKLLESNKVKSLLGKDTETLKEVLEKTDLSKLDTNTIEKDLKNIK